DNLKLLMLSNFLESQKLSLSPRAICLPSRFYPGRQDSKPLTSPPRHVVPCPSGRVDGSESAWSSEAKKRFFASSTLAELKLFASMNALNISTCSALLNPESASSERQLPQVLWSPILTVSHSKCGVTEIDFKNIQSV